jgi:PKD repeat protein
MTLKRLISTLLFLIVGFFAQAQGSCSAFFIYNIQGGNTVQFYNTSSTGMACTWNFGDGQTDNSFNPAPHWYTSTGTYVVCVTVSDTSCSASYCDTIQILHTPCTANFVFYPNGNVVHVENQSTPLYPDQGSVWSYGDGFSDTNTFPAAHLYTNPGTYIVCLTIHDSACISTQCDTIVVNTDSCHAAFTALQSDNHLLFLNNSIKPKDAFCYWEFGDGQSSSHCDSVSHVYTNTGDYAVCLTVYDSLCQNTFCDTIHVNLINGSNQISFQASLAFPNPFDNVIDFKESVKFYQLTAINGQILKQGNNVKEIIVTELKSGLYLLEYQSDQGFWQHQTMIKE